MFATSFKPHSVKHTLDIFFKKWAIPDLFFLYFCLFITVDSKYSILIFAYDWIWTADLWNWKRLFYQLSHIHCPHWTYFTNLWNPRISGFSESRCPTFLPFHGNLLESSTPFTCYNQCDQICRNFATLAKVDVYWAIFWKFISFLAKYWVYFGKFVTLLGYFPWCKWPNTEK